MIQGHGGNVSIAAAKVGCSTDEIRDMSSNINPLGCVPGLMEHLEQNLKNIMSLPEVDARLAVQGIASLLGIDDARVLMGTGTTQFIYTVCPAVEAKKVLIVGPTYSDYESSCRMHQVEFDYFLTTPDENFTLFCDRLAEKAEGFDVVFLCNANNPTGHAVNHQELIHLCEHQPKTVFIVDESYLPFVPDGQDMSMATMELDNVVVLWSISKIFGIPGLRAGFLVANSPLLDKFRRFMQPWCANSLAQEAVAYLAANQATLQEFIQKTKGYLQQEMHQFQEAFNQSPVKLYPTSAPYQLIKLPESISSSFVWEEMLKRKILIRDCSNFHGLDEKYIRISLKNSELNREAAAGMVDILSG